MNAYEDALNGGGDAFVTLLDDNCTSDLIQDVVHLANEVISHDTSLPDAPTLHEALAGPEWNEWHAAILEELSAIKEAGTWTLVDWMPDIHNIMGCQFVLQKKHSLNGEVTQFKARLIVQGFSQWEGIDYSKTFAPVVKSASLRVFLAICTKHGWHIWQMDIKSAYLNGVLLEDIYMNQPKGYEEKGSESKVAKLQRASMD